jgi:hypothetical protein
MAADPEQLRKLAVLIDADNASPRIAAGLFEEVAALGEASVRRIYGDFSGSRLKGWADVLSTHAIMPHQNFASTVGKNASDIALVIDAMDLLHSGRFDGFCLVSSDSDFTRLAARIREQGADVYGFGERKTPESFRQACKRFIYTENLVPTNPPIVKVPEQLSSAPTPQHLSPNEAVPLIDTALSQMDDLDSWYFLGALGSRLMALRPDFDARTYGCPKLASLVGSLNEYEIKREGLMVYVRRRLALAG